MPSEDHVDLDQVIGDLVGTHPVPGAGIGVWRDGSSELAFSGVTSVDNPLPTNRRTLFQIGSISKTFTATAVLHLASTGKLDLDRPVRTYLPELRLQDEQVAQTVTVGQLLNHTSGWDGTLSSGGDDPEAPLASFVETSLPQLRQLAPLGQRAEYNNAAVALAGRVVERVTELSFEDAVHELLLTPLGMNDTYFSNEDVITERVSVGHLVQEDGSYAVARPWRWPRSGNPEGGLLSTLSDCLRWARFHLGRGETSSGEQILGPSELTQMQTPTVRLVGNDMGDAIGLGWFLRTIGDEVTLGHQGTTNGQFAELRLVPGREYALIVCANGGPEGTQFTGEVVSTLLDHHLGLRPAPRQHRGYDPTRDGQVAGRYENSLATLDVSVDDGALMITFEVRPELAASLGNPTFEPCPVDFLDGDQGEYLVVGGSFEQTRGSMPRGSDDKVMEIDFGGRWYRRVDAPQT